MCWCAKHQCGTQYASAEAHLLWIVVALVVLKQQRASRTEILAAFTAAASSCGVFLSGEAAQRCSGWQVCKCASRTENEQLRPSVSSILYCSIERPRWFDHWSKTKVVGISCSYVYPIMPSSGIQTAQALCLSLSILVSLPVLACGVTRHFCTAIKHLDRPLASTPTKSATKRCWPCRRLGISQWSALVKVAPKLCFVI